MRTAIHLASLNGNGDSFVSVSFVLGTVPGTGA